MIKLKKRKLKRKVLSKRDYYFMISFLSFWGLLFGSGFLGSWLLGGDLLGNLLGSWSFGGWFLGSFLGSGWTFGSWSGGGYKIKLDQILF